MNKLIFLLLLLSPQLLLSQNWTVYPKPRTIKEEVKNGVTFSLFSPAFENNGTYPKQFTMFGDKITPPLHWCNPPQRTKSYALIMFNTDHYHTTQFTHWIIYNIPPDVFGIKKGIPAGRIFVDNEIRQGQNDVCYAFADEINITEVGYVSPMSASNLPWGTKYIFRLFALDSVLNLCFPDRKELEKAMEGHILGYTDLTVFY